MGTARSHTVDLDGPLHYIDHGGSGPVIVLVHGLGGSHVNWHDLGPLLAQRARVLALDLVGHGRTPRAGRSAAVPANARLLDRFLTEVAGVPAILVGNSMGGMISLLAAAARPDHVAGLVLIDPSVPGPRRQRPDLVVARNFALYAVPVFGERFIARRRAQLGPEGLLRDTLALCCADPSRVSPGLVEASLALIRERAGWPDNDKAFLESARSLMWLLSRPARYGEVIAAVTAPTLLVHGQLDRLVPLAAARHTIQARPDWTLEVLENLGHVPQVEAPRRTAEVVLGWLDGAGQVAVRTAQTTRAG